MKQNCWEATECGREPGGAKVDEMGPCPAATDEKYDGINGGRNAGRFCWRVPGTLCNGIKQGTWSTKLMVCAACPVFKSVKQQEGSAFTPS